MNITASDRASLIRLASSLPAGDESRRAILAGLSKSSAQTYTSKVDPVDEEKVQKVLKDKSFTGKVTYSKGKLTYDNGTIAQEFQAALGRIDVDIDIKKTAAGSSNFGLPFLTDGTTARWVFDSAYPKYDKNNPAAGNSKDWGDGKIRSPQVVTEAQFSSQLTGTSFSLYPQKIQTKWTVWSYPNSHSSPLQEGIAKGANHFERARAMAVNWIEAQLATQEATIREYVNTFESQARAFRAESKSDLLASLPPHVSVPW